MARWIFVLLVAALTSCAETSNFEKYELKDEADWQMRGYLSCMEAAANKFSDANVSPTEGAIAAQGRCAVEFAKYETAVRNFMTGSVKGAEWTQIASNKADEITREIKQKSTETTISRIVEKRMLKSESQQAPIKDGP